MTKNCRKTTVKTKKYQTQVAKIFQKEKYKNSSLSIGLRNKVGFVWKKGGLNTELRKLLRFW